MAGPYALREIDQKAWLEEAPPHRHYASEFLGEAFDPPDLDDYVKQLRQPHPCFWEGGEACPFPLSNYLAHQRDTLQAILTTYAPRVYRHPADPFGPADPLYYIARSSLWFAHDWLMPDEWVAATGTIDPKELGSYGTDRYARQAAELLWRSGALLKPSSADPVTRPHENYGIEGGDEGFYLRYEGDGYHDPLPPEGKAPLFWRLGESAVVSAPFGEPPPGHRFLFIEYWYFLNYSYNWEWETGNHQGDWEGIAFLIDLTRASDGTLTHQPLVAFYAQHEGGTWVDPDELTWVDPAAHPHVYASLGRHASYPHAGEKDGEWPHPITETAAGPAWDSWHSLRPLLLEPWYGYTGAWGEATWLASSTGPMAPSPLKGYPY